MRGWVALGSGFDPFITLDGRLNASPGTAPQYPHLFTDPNGGPAAGNATNAPYARRPRWNVAGVDYGVGCPAGTGTANPNNLLLSPNNGFLTNAATTSGNVLHTASTAGLLVGMGLIDSSGSGTQIPPGTVVTSFTPTTVTMSNNVTATVNSGDGINTTGGNIDTTNKIINFTASQGIVLDGYSFTGWQIFWNEANAPIVQNCNFNTCVLNFNGINNLSTYGDYAIIRYCTVDAAGLIQNLFNLNRHASLQYCWLKNAKNNTLSCAELDMRYCLVENSCLTTTPSDHADLIQTFPQGVGTATFTSGNSNIAYSDGAGNAPSAVMQVGSTTRFFGTPPSPFVASTTSSSTEYFVVGISGSTFQVSATFGGSPISPGANGTSDVAQSPVLLPMNMTFNTWVITTKLAAGVGSIGIVFDGNTHQNEDTAGAGYPFWLGPCEIGYNTLIGGASGGTGFSWWFGLVLSLANGPCIIHDNWVDLTGFTTAFPNNFVIGSTTSGSQPFAGPIVETNNILLAPATSATFTASSSGTTSLTVSGGGFAGYIQIGDVLSGSGVPAGTTITGPPNQHGAGTYTTSVATTLSSVACTTTVAAGTIIPTTFQ